MHRRSGRLIAALGVAVVLGALLWAVAGDAIVRSLAAATLDVATGYRFSFGELALHGDRAVARAIRVTRGGEPVFEADRADVQYRLRDLLPGGAHRYGLLSWTLLRPRVSLVRHADGSFNISPLGNALGAPLAAGGAQAPLAFLARVQDGTLTLVDSGRVEPASRELTLTHLTGRLAYDSGSRSRYELAGDLAGDPGQGLSVRGRFDAGGFALHRVRARTVALPALLNYLVNSAGARIQGGTASDLDVSLYSFGNGAGDVPAYHLAGSATLRDGAMRLPGLLRSASGMQGRIDVSDDGIAAPELDAKVGDVAVKLAGGLFNWGKPALRLGLIAETSRLESVRRLFRFAARLPVRGEARTTVFLEGPVALPLVATSFRAGRVFYGRFPLTDVSGRALYHAGAVNLLGVRAGYGGLALAANGAIDVAGRVSTQLVARVSGPAAGVPYLAQVAPAAWLEAGGLLSGPGLKLATHGAAKAAGGGVRVAAVFGVDAAGDGTLGPLDVERDDGAAATGTMYLNRSASESGFWLEARGLPLGLRAPAPRLPGLAFAPPDFAGRLDGSLAGDGPPSRFRLAGRLHASALQVGNVKIDDVRGNLAGAIGNFRLGELAARGPWGTFRGQGAMARGALALVGDYRGSFAQLAAFSGNLGGQGPIRGPVALLLAPNRTIVQARSDATPGSSVRGVPVERVAGTLAVTGRHLRIYAATAQVAGGLLAAAGTLEGQGLGVSLGGAEGARLSALAPLHQGTVSAIGRLLYGGPALQFDGGLVVAGATFYRLPLDANGEVRLSGPRLELLSTDAALGGAIGSVAGSADDLGTANARYDVGVRVAVAPLAPLARFFAPARRDISGTLEADVRIRGPRTAPQLTGTVGIPEGVVHGLPFSRASARVILDRGGMSARRGRVTVGETKVRFGGALHGDDVAVRLDIPHADLTDFNDYFDAGDTFAGSGHLSARFARRAGTARTSADIGIAGLRYRRFDLGDASARWHSRDAAATGAIAFGGPSGRLETAGTLQLAQRAPLGEMLSRSRFSGTARLRSLDLGVWLPALGYQFPLTGRLDADATLAGPLRSPAVTTDASLVGGTLGAFPVDRLLVSARSSLTRTTLTKAELDLQALTVVGSGTFGLRAADPVSLALHASSADVGSLSARAFGGRFPLSGTGEVDLKVKGTRAHPQVAGGVELEQAALRGVAIPRALGEFSIRGRDIVLSDVEVGFASGTLYFAGSVPLELAPLRLGPPPAPITLELQAKAIDLADFAPLLPAGSTLHGRVDGHVVVGGNAGAPRLAGSLALANGALQSPLETTPLTNLSGRLVLSGDEVALEALHGEAGGGTFDASGRATLPNLVRPASGGAYNFEASAKALRLSLPAYGSGQLDGDLKLRRAGGGPPRLAGDVELSDATIPFSALFVAGSGSTGTGGGFDGPGARPGASTSDLALDLSIQAGRNVRVRSANVDIGATGTLHAGGHLNAPKLAGTFVSTGGTLAYFNTVFRLLEANVTFAPDLGLVPTLQAQATTHVTNPDPNTVRNAAGTADITLNLTGPVTNLNIGLTSDPPYAREQILGLLLNAPAFGATNLFGETSHTATLYGTNGANALPTGVAGNRASNGQLSVAQEAFGIANAQFTRTLLAPFETTFASAVGLTSFNVNVDYTGSVGVTARKILGKNVNAIYGTSFGYPYRQSFGFELKPSEMTAAQVTVFETFGSTGLSSLAPPAYISAGSSKVQAAQPAAGTVGFSLSLQRLYP